jgi:prepilin-type N-terminal cleavage/methylation domain-containing protein
MWRASKGRRGFTLLELAVSTAILGVLMAGIFSAFMGSRKAQGTAVTQSMMKLEGQKLLKQLYGELTQLRRILSSTDAAPAGEDIGRSYYNRLDIPVGRITKMPDANVRFPRVSPGSSFTNVGLDPGQMRPTWFGNALIFVTRDRLLSISTPNVDIKFGGGATRSLTVDKPFRLNTYRIIAYFMDERVRVGDEAQIMGLNHTYGLVRWESRPYVEKNELEGFFNLMADSTDRAVVWDELETKRGVAGCWDINNPDAATAFYDVDLNGAFLLVDQPIAMEKLKRAMDLKTEPYAKGFIAFNTTDGAFKPSDLNNKSGLDVPRFGEEQMIVPYGFEIGITGGNAGRAILIRIAMAARLAQGGHIYGQSQQTIIQAVDN